MYYQTFFHTSRGLGCLLGRLSSIKLKAICLVAERELQSRTQYLNINKKYAQPSFRGVQTNGTHLRDLQTFPGY